MNNTGPLAIHQQSSKDHAVLVKGHCLLQGLFFGLDVWELQSPIPVLIGLLFR